MYAYEDMKLGAYDVGTVRGARGRKGPGYDQNT